MLQTVELDLNMKGKSIISILILQIYELTLKYWKKDVEKRFAIAGSCVELLIKIQKKGIEIRKGVKRPTNNGIQHFDSLSARRESSLGAEWFQL